MQDSTSTQKFTISIPSYRLNDPSSTEAGGKPHHVYQIVLNFGYSYLKGEDNTIVVEKRYSEFHQLHTELRKNNLAPTETPFPPKRVRNFNPKVLESRRTDLEVYMCALVSQQPMLKEVETFLGIPTQKRVSWVPPYSPEVSSHSSSDRGGGDDSWLSYDELDFVNGSPVVEAATMNQHRPTLTYSQDPFVVSEVDANNGLPNIILEGVCEEMYTL